MIILALVAAIVMRFVSEGALIEGVVRARQGGTMTTREGFRAGWAHWGVLVRIALLYFAATIGSLALLAAPCVIALKALGPLGGVVLGIPALFIAVPWLVTLYLVQAFASRIAVLENRHALDAIGKSRLFLHGRLMHGLKLIVAMFVGTLVIVFLGLVAIVPVALLLAALIPLLRVFPVIVLGCLVLLPAIYVLDRDGRDASVLDLDDWLRHAGGIVIAAASMPPPPVKTQWASATASPLAVLFAILSSRLGGDAEPLAEDAIARLVEQARAGDTGARRTLYMQHVDRVFRTVRGMLRSDADAEDVTQDALLTVLTSLHKYTPRVDARFAAWVTTIAVNTVRRRFRRRRPELTATGELPETPDDTADPADDLDRARQRRALLIALGELPERERAIVSLRYGAELNASEIAATLGLEPATIRKILERARTRLGARIEALLSPDGGMS